MSLRLARVVAVHPKTRTVDLVFNDTGMRVAGVQVQTPHASTDSGSWDVPDVPKPTSESGPDALAKSGRNLVAVCDFVGHVPVVQGFLHPAGGEMQFSEQNRSVHRHASGAYTTTAPDGSYQLALPGGAFVRIGTGAAQENLGTVSADGNWSIPSGAPLATVVIATAGNTVTINPNGDMTIISAHKLVVQATGGLDITGDTKITGKLDVTQEVTAKAGTGSSVTLSQHKGHTGGALAPTPGT